jgi:hypothetical protein
MKIESGNYQNFDKLSIFLIRRLGLKQSRDDLDFQLELPKNNQMYDIRKVFGTLSGLIDKAASFVIIVKEKARKD